MFGRCCRWGCLSIYVFFIASTPNAAAPTSPKTTVESAAAGSPHDTHAGVGVPGAGDPIDKALDEVTAIHGAAGPWAVLGYRMSEHALGKLGLPRGSIDVQVVHWTPK